MTPRMCCHLFFSPPVINIEQWKVIILGWSPILAIFCQLHYTDIERCFPPVVFFFFFWQNAINISMLLRNGGNIWKQRLYSWQYWKENTLTIFTPSMVKFAARLELTNKKLLEEIIKKIKTIGNRYSINGSVSGLIWYRRQHCHYREIYCGWCYTR